jgi:hypothetical protein
VKAPRIFPKAISSAALILFLVAGCDKHDAGPAPVVASFVYTSGVVGSQVSITGDHFFPTPSPEQGKGAFPNTSIVMFNGIKAEAKFGYQDDVGVQRIDAKVPVGATTGRITITTNGGTGSSAEDFIVAVPAYLSNVVVATLSSWGTDVAAGSDGTLYLTQNAWNKISKISPTGTVSTLWTSSAAEIIYGIAVDATGNVFASVNNSYILKIASDGKAVALAGSTAVSGYADGQGANARFQVPLGLAVDKDGNVYVADVLNYRVRKITPDGTVSTLAGSVTRGDKDGVGSNAQFDQVIDVAVDGEGNVFATDGSRIRKITPAGQVTTISGSVRGYLDGATANARFNELTGIVVDLAGNLYVCDQFNYTVRRIAKNGTVVTVAGTNKAGDIDGLGSIAQFDYLSGITIDPSGIFYLSQTLGRPIRKIVVQ